MFLQLFLIYLCALIIWFDHENFDSDLSVLWSIFSNIFILVKMELHLLIAHIITILYTHLYFSHAYEVGKCLGVDLAC